MNRKFYIIEYSEGKAFTTFKDKTGRVRQLELMSSRIGPFGSIPECADYLVINSSLGCQYAMIEERTP